MKLVTEVVLKPTRDRSIRRRHPWILSGASDRIEGAEEPESWVRVRSAEGEVLGYGHLSPGSALDSGRAVQVLRVLGPPVDHPVSIDHPEGNYLTGLLMQA